MGKRFNKIKNCLTRRNKKTKAVEKKVPLFDYQALPTDLKRCILDFLPSDDVLSLTQTCKGVTSELELSSSTQSVPQGPCNKNISVMNFSQMSNPLCRIAAIVPTETERMQSISFQCEWVDQGMGKLKGKLYVVAQKMSLLQDNNTKRYQAVPFQEGRVVCGPAHVDHIMSNISLTFHPKPDEFYQIWCFVGDSCGNMLHFKNMRFNILRYGAEPTTSCSVLKYRFSYEEDDETHMKRMSIRWMDYMFFKGALLEEQ